MPGQDSHRVIREEAVVGARVEEVWNAWVTEEGVKSFLAPACNIDVYVDGPYEIFFDPGAEPGAEGVRILAFEPRKMLSFTWNAPPELPEVRKERTHVVIGFEEFPGDRTKLTLTHDGWRGGKE